MVHYKLTYFNFTGIAEVTRQLFALAGQEFEDHRITMEQWPAIKDSMIFGHVPELEVDGKILGQSTAIARYVAKKYGFVGKTAWDEAQVDSLGDQLKDFMEDVRPFLRASAGYPGMPDPAGLFVELFIPATKKHFPLFAQFLKKNKSGFFVGDSVTWFDLQFAEFTAIFNSKGPQVYDDFPEFLAHAEKVHSIPAIKKWRAERPESIV